MLRLFRVVKKINNQVLESADIGEILYQNETGIYNAYNQKICDVESEIAKECIEEITN